MLDGQSRRLCLCGYGGDVGQVLGLEARTDGIGNGRSGLELLAVEELRLLYMAATTD
jgi:hypothetical protein